MLVVTVFLWQVLIAAHLVGHPTVGGGVNYNSTAAVQSI
jgi:hypothetical protein